MVSASSYFNSTPLQRRALQALAPVPTFPKHRGTFSLEGGKMNADQMREALDEAKREAQLQKSQQPPFRIHIGPSMTVDYTSTPSYSRRNVGRFDIDAEFFNFEWMDNNLEIFRRMMADMIVIRCEYAMNPHGYGNVLRYTAISPHFSPVPPAMEIPKYRTEVTVEDGELIEIKWICERTEDVFRRFKNAEGGVDTAQQENTETKS
jgi:hypothetical protein